MGEKQFSSKTIRQYFMQKTDHSLFNNVICVFRCLGHRSQAEEYMRLSQVKCTGLGNSTATSKAVICLELAATALKFPLDKVSPYFINRSGPSLYTDFVNDIL